jgi:hypothetical protein
VPFNEDAMRLKWFAIGAAPLEFLLMFLAQRGKVRMAAIMPIKRHKMNELTLANRAADWRRLKGLVLDSVSSPITKRVYNPGLDEFFAWYGQEPRPGFTKATVAVWRVALEARGLGAVSINVRITAVRKLAVEASDNGLLAGTGERDHTG